MHLKPFNPKPICFGKKSISREKYFPLSILSITDELNKYTPALTYPPPLDCFFSEKLVIFLLLPKLTDPKRDRFAHFQISDQTVSPSPRDRAQ